MPLPTSYVQGVRRVVVLDGSGAPASSGGSASGGTAATTSQLAGGIYNIGFGLVTGAADADNTGVGAGDILGLNIMYA